MKNILEELQNLDPNNPGLWPFPIQIGAGLILCAGLIFAGFYFHVQDQRDELDGITKKEDEYKQTFELKQRKAANLVLLKQQMEEMKQSFGDMLRQLPNKTEIAGLIVDVSQTGLAAGLEFDLFKPEAEKPTEFYAELPINIVVKGKYHQLGEFISGIAQLPRIVTTHNINITKSGDLLQMKAVVKTYRALEED